MRMNPERRRRHSLRMRGYDYSQPGVYFVTICVRDQMLLFGEVVAGEMRRNAAGLMVARLWAFLPRRFPGIEVDALVVMPNHVHGVIVLGTDPDIADAAGGQKGKHGGLPLRPTRPASSTSTPAAAPVDVRADLRVCPVPEDNVDPSWQPSLGTIIQWFKSITTTDCIAGVNHMDWPPFGRRLWHRNYFDCIVRNDRELDRVRAYIANNPANWLTDDENRGRG